MVNSAVIGKLSDYSFTCVVKFNVDLYSQHPRGVQQAEAAGPTHHRHPRRGRLRPRGARPDRGRREEALVRAEADEEVSDRRDEAAAGT